MKLQYVLVDKNNIDLAVKIQNIIFPTEDASRQYHLSLTGDDMFPVLEYYLVYDGDINNEENIIGVTGLYTYKGYPTDAWLAYYGVLPEKRGKGYGYVMLKDFENEARKRGFEHIRLYTNKILFPNAYKVYINYGFFEEPYTNFGKKFDKIIEENEIVFSKNIQGNQIVKWDNKLLLDFDVFHD